MIKNTSLIFCLYFCAFSSHAAIMVFTDSAAWEAAVFSVPTGHLHNQDFEFIPTGGLVTGLNGFHPLTVSIPGSPGYNAIDNSISVDPFSNALSPNGSTYYLGDVGVNAFPEPSLLLFDYSPGFNVIGFAADWVVQGNFFIEVQGTVVSFADYLPSGSGFLGILTDQGEVTLTGNLSGDAVFGMDDLITGNTQVPLPAAVWLFGSGLISLIGYARRGKHNELRKTTLSH